MAEYCIFHSKKTCTHCGECERCDLNNNKKCNNCGKCLELAGYDIRAIQIDDIYDSKEDLSSSETLMDQEGVAVPSEQDEIWEYIDDVKEIKDLLAEEEALKESSREAFPGLIIIDAKEI